MVQKMVGHFLEWWAKHIKLTKVDIGKYTLPTH